MAYTIKYTGHKPGRHVRSTDDMLFPPATNRTSDRADGERMNGVAATALILASSAVAWGLIYLAAKHFFNFTW